MMKAFSSLLFLLLVASAAHAQDEALRTEAWKKALACMRAGNYSGAQDAFTSGFENGEKRWRAYLMRGYARYRLGRDDALADLEVAGERHPENAYVWAAQAMAVELLGQFDMERRRRAVSLMSLAIERDKTVAIYYALRGRLKVGANKFADAMADFDTALKLSPDDLTVLQLQHRALLEWGGHEADAERVRARIKQLDPEGKAPDPVLPPPPIPDP